MNEQQNIQAINKVFFDSFAEIGGEPDEAFESYQEQMWRDTVSVAVSHLRRSQARIEALEIGAGRGYATADLYSHLRAGDSLTCNDISQGMLKDCQAKVAELASKRGTDTPNVSYLVGSYDSISLPQRANLVFMNAVAHHIPDLRGFFRHIDSLLAPGGVIVMGREPNHAFWNHWLLFPLHLWTARAVRVARAAKNLVGRPTEAERDLEAEAARIALVRLRQQGITHVGSVELTENNLGGFVDIQAPQGATAEEKQKGLSVEQIIAALSPSQYEALHFKTYNHLANMEVKALARPLEELMSRAFPRGGMHMLCVLKKRSEGSRSEA